MKKLLPFTLLTLTSFSLSQQKPTFETPVQIEADGKPISISYGFTFPTVIDLDKDGLIDLLVGEYRNGGEIYFYKNIGTKTLPKYAKAQNLMVGDKVLTVPGVGT